MESYITKEELSEIGKTAAEKAINRAIKKAKNESNRYVAELTMPNVGSWNGKWSGSENRYTFQVKNKKAKELLGSYYYNFGDGWSACVQIRKAEPKEKMTNKFAGYEWMVESIIKKGKIESSC